MRTKSRAILAAAFVTWLCVALAATASSQDANGILLYKGADRAQRLIEGARKEGQVVLYSAMIVPQALRPLADKFGKKYPFVKLTYWRADSEDIVQKAAAEVNARNVVADVIEGTGAGELGVRAGIVQPFDTPALDTYAQAYRDPEHLWTATRLSYFSIAYNTRMVPATKVPRSYDDLLDPQWKGKLAWRIGSSTGAALFLTNLRLAWGEERARIYFEKLKEQRLINFGAGSARTLVDRVIAGEYPIALNIFAHHPLISKAKGAPVDSSLLDPVASTAATMSLVKGLKHAHAAMLLVDFVLSREGQEILASAEYFPADQRVSSLPALAGVVPSVAGIAENFVGPEALSDYTDRSEEIFRAIFR
jgi:iron(III) transport system substrate-binding protein